jgi:xylulokinase
MAIALGIDVGTSAIKVALIDKAGLLAEAQAPLVTNHPQPGYSEQDPQQWIDATIAALFELRIKAPDAFATTGSIGFSGQMHGLVMLDAHHKPIRPAILWNDARASLEATELQQAYPDLAEIAGVYCTASFIAPKLKWLSKHEAGTISATKHILFPKDFVRLWMTGEIATDPVDAAGSWLFDQQNGKWSDALCQTAGLDQTMLPPVKPSQDIAGFLERTIADKLGLSVGIPVVVGAGDAAAGCIGLGMAQQGDAFISLGTSSQIFVTTAAYKPQIPSLIHTFAHAIPGHWFQMAAMLNGASALKWWSEICAVNISQLLQEAATVSPSIDAPYFLPYLSGERTPHNNPSARAAFMGLDRSAGRGDLTRAVLEGVAFTLADGLAALENAGSNIQELAMTGGGAKSPFWAQIISTTLNKPLNCFQDAAIGPVIGAARLALANRINVPFFAQPAIHQKFYPAAKMGEMAAERLERWRSVYRLTTSH